MKGESTSTVIYNFLATRRKTTISDLRALPKEEFRAELIEAGDYLVGALDTLKAPPLDDALDKIVWRMPSTLVRTLYMAGYNVVDGVRRHEELTHTISHLAWNGVRALTLWIEKPDGPKIPDNTELTAADADEAVLNDGTLEQLREKLQAVLVKRFGPQPDQNKPIDIFAEEDLPRAPAADLAKQVSAAIEAPAGLPANEL